MKLESKLHQRAISPPCTHLPKGELRSACYLCVHVIMQWTLHKPDLAKVTSSRLQFLQVKRRMLLTAHCFTYLELKPRVCNTRTCKQSAFEMQCLPSTWQSSLVSGLQIYYPLFYLLRVARNTTDDSIKTKASLNVEQMTLLGSVTAAFIWALWLNVRCLLPSLQVLTLLSKYNIGAFGAAGDTEGIRPEVPEHQLDTMPDIGLNLHEVEGRRYLYGRNEVTSSPHVSWKQWKLYLWSCIDPLTVPLEVGFGPPPRKCQYACH